MKSGFVLHNVRGFSMIEVMVALSIFGLVSAAVGPSFSMFMKHNTDALIKTKALAAAQQKLDQLRLNNPQSLPSSGRIGPETFTIDGKNFSVYTSYCVTSAYCNTANNRDIKVEAYYNNVKRYEVETVYTALR